MSRVIPVHPGRLVPGFLRTPSRAPQNSADNSTQKTLVPRHRMSHCYAGFFVKHREKCLHMFGKGAVNLPRVQFLYLLTIQDWLYLQIRTRNAGAVLQPLLPSPSPFLLSLLLFLLLLLLFILLFIFLSLFLSFLLSPLFYLPFLPSSLSSSSPSSPPSSSPFSFPSSSSFYVSFSKFFLLLCSCFYCLWLSIVCFLGKFTM